MTLYGAVGGRIGAVFLACDKLLNADWYVVPFFMLLLAKNLKNCVKNRIMSLFVEIEYVNVDEIEV